MRWGWILLKSLSVAIVALFGYVLLVALALQCFVSIAFHKSIEAGLHARWGYDPVSLLRWLGFSQGTTEFFLLWVPLLCFIYGFGWGIRRFSSQT